MNQIVLAVIFLIIGIFGGGIAFWFLGRRPKKGDESILMLHEQLKEIRGTLDSKLGESTKAIQYQFSESAKIIRDVTERLVKLDEKTKQVVNFTDQLNKFQDILTNPKQRGTFGEYHLETELQNFLPPGRFQMQYEFKDGDKADAVLFLDKDKMLAIDSKFSLENYNRMLEAHGQSEREEFEKLFKQDLKSRIDETAKYIKPKEGTLDYAFMFIPSEAIYYDLLINQVGAVKSNTRDLVEYAFRQRHVIIVSPTTLMAYLQTVLQGLRALQIEESAKEIRKRVEDLGRHLGGYEQFMKKLGVNLAATVNTYNNSYKEFQKIDKDVLRITGDSVGSEAQMLDKPEEIE